MEKKQKSFEDAMERLETIVRELERGEAPLEQSLKLFQEGAALVSDCEKRLQKAEQSVLKLQKGPDGEPQELPFEEEKE